MPTAPLLERDAVLAAAEAHGYPTIAELADAVGVHRISMYRALSPTAPRSPSARMLQGLAHALADTDLRTLLRDVA